MPEPKPIKLTQISETGYTGPAPTEMVVIGEVPTTGITPGDVGAVAKAGDTMSGPLKVVDATAEHKVLLAMHDPGAQQNAVTTIGAGSTYLHVGGGEWATGSYRLIGFGYVSPDTNPSPAFIGYNETSITSYTHGDLIFGTRSVNTNTAPPIVMRITSAGQIKAESTGYAPSTPESFTDKKYVDAADALKAPLASPALTGTPTAPTAAAATNTTQVATTAFVKGQTSAKAQITALTAVATADATDLDTAIALANANKAAINAIIAALKA